MKYNSINKAKFFLAALLLLFSLSLFTTPFRETEVPKSSASVTLTIVVTYEQQNWLSDVIPAFLASPMGAGIDDVNIIVSGATYDDQFAYISTHLAAHSSDIDIMEMELTWTPSFVEKGWLVNLDPYLTLNEMDNYIYGMVDAGEYKGHQWAYPFSYSSGFLYYRTDLLNNTFGEGGWTTADFDTWEELNVTANAVLLHENDPNLFGYVGQFDNYEGGAVNFQEWIGSNGGVDIFEPDGTPNVTKPEMVEALSFLKALIPPVGITDLINTQYIIPRYALTYNEGDTHAAWTAGNALFARNWPYMYEVTLDSPYNDSFGVLSIPTFHGTPDEKSSCVGGTIFGIPAYSLHKDAAFNLTKWLCLNESQYYALKNYGISGHLPALKDTYSTLPPGFEYAADFYIASDVSFSRTKHPQYPEISDAMSDRFTEIISCQKSAIQGLNDLQQDIVYITTPEIFFDIVDEQYTANIFKITFYLSNATGDPINDATFQMWWNETDVSSSVLNYGNGSYSVDLTPISVSSGENPILLNMTISADGFKDKYIERYIAVDLEIYVDVVDEQYTANIFKITFYLSNATGDPINDATFQMWWNGIDVSSSVQNHGNGNYSVNLTPITVISGEDPILLNMTITANGFNDKYFEIYIAVEPESPNDEIIPGYDLLLFSCVVLCSIIVIYSKIKQDLKN
ncbi:MAG: extracellular solute-binding protein [Promethearchaeota archaeon]